MLKENFDSSIKMILINNWKNTRWSCVLQFRLVCEDLCMYMFCTWWSSISTNCSCPLISIASFKLSTLQRNRFTRPKSSSKQCSFQTIAFDMPSFFFLCTPVFYKKCVHNWTFSVLPFSLFGRRFFSRWVEDTVCKVCQKRVARADVVRKDLRIKFHRQKGPLLC